MTAVLALPAPAPARPPAPLPAALAAVGVAADAAGLLPGGPPGLGVVLCALLVALVLLRAGAVRDRWAAVLLGSALLLAAGALLRDAGWVVLLDLLGALGLLVLVVLPHRTWTGLAAAPVRLALEALPAVGWVVRGLRPLLARGRDAAPLLRGLLLAVVVLVVFVPLLRSADRGFAQVLDRLLLGRVPVDLAVGRAVVLGLALLGTAAAAAVLLAPPAEPRLPAPRRRLQRAGEWLPPLLALDLLLAAFLVVQGDPRALAVRVATEPDLTYAQQVHAGFWQLLAVTGLVLAVVAAAARWTALGAGVRTALGALCALTLLVGGSALARLDAYTAAYGLTRLRVLVALSVLVLLGVLLLVLLAGLLPAVARELPRLVVALVAVALAGLTAYDPDAAIARSGVDRGAAADVAYLRTLSADAAPALRLLPPGRARDCLLSEVLPQDDAPWTSWNLSRARSGTAPTCP